MVCEWTDGQEPKDGAKCTKESWAVLETGNLGDDLSWRRLFGSNTSKVSTTKQENKQVYVHMPAALTVCPMISCFAFCEMSQPVLTNVMAATGSHLSG